MAAISLSERDVYEYFGSTYAGRGNSYQRSRRVLSAQIDVNSNTLTGEVQGGNVRPYKLKIQLGRNGGSIKDSDCSCPMGGYCKHAAALLLDIIRTGKLNCSSLPNNEATVPETSGRTSQNPQTAATKDSFWTDKSPGKHSNENYPVPNMDLSSQLTSWINNLSASLSPESQPSTNNNHQNNNGSVLYLLDTTPYSPQLTLNLVQAKRLKSGGWGKPQKTDLDRLSIGGARYVTAEDSEIGKLFLSATRDSTWLYRNRFPELPELSQIILQRLLATGRCFWKDVSVPLTLSSPKQGELRWETQSDGKQVLRLHSSGKGDLAVIAGTGWYVNVQKQVLGPLVIPAPLKALSRLY